jgi:hypothetical protein
MGPAIGSGEIWVSLSAFVNAVMNTEMSDPTWSGAHVK